MRKISKKVSRRRSQLGSAIAQALEGRLLMSTTWTVTTYNDDGSTGSLRYAIQHSAAGDTIDLPAAAGNQMAIDAPTIAIDHDLTINGQSALIRRSLPSTAITVEDFSWLKATRSVGLCLHQYHGVAGNAHDWAGFRCSGQCPFRCRFTTGSIESECSGNFGGAINANDSTIKLDHDEFNNNNRNDYGGGAIACFNGSLSVESCSFSGNRDVVDGGGIYTAAAANADNQRVHILK